MDQPGTKQVEPRAQPSQLGVPEEELVLQRTDLRESMTGRGIASTLHQANRPKLHQRDVPRRKLRLPLRDQAGIGRRILRRIGSVPEHLLRVVDPHEPADLGEDRFGSHHQILVVDLVDRLIAPQMCDE